MSLRWFFILLFCIIVIQRILETFSRREKETGKIYQKWTFTIYFISHVIVSTGTILEFLFLNRDINFMVTIVGIVLYLCGLIIRNWAIRSLGKFWSIHIEIRKNHKMIKMGPYKYMRHPAYLSILCEIWGLPLIMNAYFTFIFAAVIYIPITIVMIYYEEKQSLKIFGPKYMAYQREVGALFPRMRRSNKK
jgi:protein-S-isoprenylcysteine O-methyltransferase Ste14